MVNFFGFVVTDANVITNTITVYGNSFTTVHLVYSLGKRAVAVYCFIFIILLFILLKKGLDTRTDNTANERLILIKVGLIIMFIGALTDIIPTLGQYPLDILASLINAILIVVAIYKYRLLELRFIITKGIVYSVFVLFLVGGYVYAILSADKSMGNVSASVKTYLTAFLAIVVAVIFQQLYGLTSRIVEKMFYKAEYSQRQALRTFSVKIC